jgi:TetR/AcrR family transcriptional regulator of autoinduction and epiphytic fitness
MPELRKHNTDGRIARGERTRDAIVEAHTSLLQDGVLKPTGKLIAERADISLRTLWSNFRDLEALLVETSRHWLESDAALRVAIDPAGSLAERIDLFCRMRAQRWEHLAPAARSAALGEPFSAALRRSRAEHVARVQADLDAVFAGEIASAGPRSADLRAALFVASSWPSWSSMRDDLGLDVDAATSVVRSTLMVLLTRTDG